MSIPLFSFPFYVADYRDSETRLAMSLMERGLYLELLIFHYKEGSLPSDLATLVKVAGCTQEEFDGCWARVQRNFTTSAELPGRLVNAKVLEVLAKIEPIREARRQAGVRSAASRRRKFGTASPTERVRNVEPEGEQSQQELYPPLNSSPRPAAPAPVVRWKSDEAFVRFVGAYNATGAALIDEDFSKAFEFCWKTLDWEQKSLRMKAVESHTAEYQAEPRFVPKPLAFLEQEWKRPVRPPAGSGKAASKQAAIDDSWGGVRAAR